MSTLLAHGACLSWQPALIWLNAISDAAIAGTFFITPFVLGSFVWRRRRDVMFRGFFWAFTVFVALCGLTRVLAIVNLWMPVYGVEAAVKSFLALISVGIAFGLLAMRP